MLAGLRIARNRVTHEVDEVGCVFATAKRPDGCAAAWTRRSLPPRLGQRQAVLHSGYERAIAGRDVVKTLLIVTVFLGPGTGCGRTTGKMNLMPVRNVQPSGHNWSQLRVERAVL